MKTKLLLLLFIVSTSPYAMAQCTMNATDSGNNTGIPAYNVSGDIEVVLNTDDTVTLNLGSNFTTAAGPDIRAYLVASNGLSDTALGNTLITNLENFQFGLVGAIGSVSQNGAKSFTVDIPNGVNIEDYDRVLFYCLEFNQFWDFAKIQPFNTTNCALLSVTDTALIENINFYPNPVKDNLTVTNNSGQDIEVQIFDVLGKEVLSAGDLNATIERINLTSLKTGVYLVRITANEQSITKRLLKD